MLADHAANRKGAKGRPGEAPDSFGRSHNVQNDTDCVVVDVNRDDTTLQAH